MPRNMPPPPTRWTPRTIRSCASSGGADPIQETTESTIAETGSSIASRTSALVSMTVRGRPLISSRPRTSAPHSSSVGWADPMASLICSAVCSPTAMPCSRRTKTWTAASMSKLPTRTASRATTPPREMSAVSVVPPPMSTTMFPTGCSIGRRRWPQPWAAPADAPRLHRPGGRPP